MTQWATLGPDDLPDFVLLGIPNRKRGGVLVYASNDLTQPQLRAVARLRESDAHRYVLSTQLGNVVVAAGATYGDALADLMTWWSPRRDESPALPAPGSRAIEPPR